MRKMLYLNIIQKISKYIYMHIYTRLYLSLAIGVMGIGKRDTISDKTKCFHMKTKCFHMKSLW